MANPSPVRSWLTLAVLLVLVAILLTRTEKTVETPPQTTEFSGTVMTVPYRIVIGEHLKTDQKRKAQQIISNTFAEINSRYNQWNPNSEISHLNSLDAYVEAQLSPEMENFLRLVDRMVQMTEGRFDPTIGPLKQLWVPHLEEGTIPSSQQIAIVWAKTGWHHIHINDNHFYKDQDGVNLNFDAVAKGFGVDLLSHNLFQAGFPSNFIEWGGEIKTTGQHPENRPWRVYISGVNSSKTEDALAFLELDNTAMATSGDYHQQWSVESQEGKLTIYSHIFDPYDLKPIQVKPGSIASASVRTSSCAVADALATAAMIFPDAAQSEQWAKRVQERYPSFTFWLASRGGKQL